MAQNGIDQVTATANGRSAALDFLEEAERVERELMLARDDIAVLKEQLHQANNMVELSKHENDALRQELSRERAKTTMWLAYTMSLSGQMKTIRAAIDTATSMSEEAARSAAEHGLTDEANAENPDDQKQLEQVINNAVERVPSDNAMSH